MPTTTDLPELNTLKSRTNALRTRWKTGCRLGRMRPSDDSSGERAAYGPSGPHSPDPIGSGRLLRHCRARLVSAHCGAVAAVGGHRNRPLLRRCSRFISSPVRWRPRCDSPRWKSLRFDPVDRLPCALPVRGFGRRRWRNLRRQQATCCFFQLSAPPHRRGRWVSRPALPGRFDLPTGDRLAGVKRGSSDGFQPPPAGNTPAILLRWWSPTCGSTCRWWSGLSSRWSPNSTRLGRNSWPCSRPNWQRTRDRLQHLWLPVLGPATLVAPATYTFFFSFTSVRPRQIPRTVGQHGGVVAR